MPCANHDWSIERDVIASESPSTSMYATIFVPYFFTKGFEFKQQHLCYSIFVLIFFSKGILARFIQCLKQCFSFSLSFSRVIKLCLSSFTPSFWAEPSHTGCFLSPPPLWAQVAALSQARGGGGRRVSLLIETR